MSDFFSSLPNYSIPWLGKMKQTIKETGVKGRQGLLQIFATALRMHFF